MRKINQELLDHNQKYIVAVSGGPDSMFLLANLVRLGWTQNLIVAHVNYKKRESSDRDEQIVRTFCLQNNLLFVPKVINNYKTLPEPVLAIRNFQAQARVIRYDFFAQLVLKYKANGGVIIAHNYTDNLETFLIQLDRKSLPIWYGLQEIGVYEHNLPVIRPMLKVKRCEIIKYLHHHKISYGIDETNNTDHYLRNRIRRTLANPFRCWLLNLEQKRQNIKLIKLYNEFDNNISNQIKLKWYAHLSDIEQLRWWHYYLINKQNKQLIKGSQCKELQKKFSKPICNLIYPLQNGYVITVSRGELKLLLKSELQKFTIHPTINNLTFNERDQVMIDAGSVGLSKLLITNESNNFNLDKKLKLNLIFKKSQLSIFARYAPIVFYQHKLISVSPRIMNELSRHYQTKINEVLLENNKRIKVNVQNFMIK